MMVDFSNAVIECKDKRAFTIQNTHLGMSGTNLYKSNGAVINTNATNNAFADDEKMWVVFAGTFTQSGTEFYISTSPSYKYWRVSNISFNAGDDYSFVVTVYFGEPAST